MVRRVSSAFRAVLPLAAALLLAGCEAQGAGRERMADPPPANAAPVFTSAAATNTAENSEGVVYVARARDDTRALTFSLAGGPDRSAFSLTRSGALSFVAPPDFEFPADADRDNVYRVRLAVSDGATSAVMDLAVAVTNAGPDGYRVRRVATGLVEPLFVAPMPDGSGRVFVVQKGGLIRLLDPSTGGIRSTPFLDVSTEISTGGERGLLGLATARDFVRTGTFYVYLTNTGGTIELRRYRTFPNNRNRADPATRNVILRIPHPDFSNHNGGWIGFGNDNYLYLAVGDGGGGGDPDNNGQNRNVLLGKILRINVAQDAFPNDAARDYAIPSGNPFAGGGGRPEIWAYGLRNPFRASIDPTTGSLWVGDVGQGAREEIDLIRGVDRGGNYGWDVMEGTAVFSGTPRASMILPVAEYLHGTGQRQGNSVTGGYVYRGPIEALRAQYIFGDFVRGNVWSAPISRLRVGSTLPSGEFTIRNADFAPDVGAISNISSFGLDQAGNLYIVDYDGEIFRIEPI
jgi:hypothetical protein